MKSIDKLREWADGLRGIWLDPNDHSIIVTTCDDMVPSMDCVSLREHVNAILDGIEREVADMRDFCERLDDAATKREDVTLWGVDYTPLPLDADGVPIHVGDVMDNTHKDGFRAKRVTGIAYHENGRTTIEVDEDRLRWHNADKLRHHHAPTVEDVLREFAYGLGVPVADSYVAAAAAKLRLAGDE